MEIISLIIGLIAGIMLRKVKTIFIIIISLTNTYFVLKYFHPELEILPIKEWTFSNLFFGYNFWKDGIFWFLLIALFFHKVIPLLLHKIKNHLIFNFKVENLIFFNEEDFFIFMKIFMKPVVKFFMFFSTYIPDNKEIEIEKTDYNHMISNTIMFFSFLIHSAAVLSMLLDGIFWVLLTAIMLFVYFFFLLPFMYNVQNYLDRIFLELSKENKKNTI